MISPTEIPIVIGSIKGYPYTMTRDYYLKHRERIIARELRRYRANRSERIAKATAWRKANWDRWYTAHRKRTAENPAIHLKAAAKFRENHREQRRAEGRIYSRQYRPTHLAQRAAAQRERECLRLMAMPPWADRNAILRFYVEARRKTLRSGIPHHVDHVYPLQGSGFVGLHVPWNLRVVTAAINQSKGNRLDDR